MAETLPLFPLGTVLFPGMVLPLHIFEERYRTLLAHRANNDPMFGVVLTRSGREVSDQPLIHDIGTAASLLEAVRYADGRADIAVRGGRRFRVLDGNWDAGYLTAAIAWLDEGDLDSITAFAAKRLVDRVRRAFADYLDALERTAGVRIERGNLGHEPAQVAYGICSLLPLPAAQRQRLLEANTPVTRLEDLLATLRRERELVWATGIIGGGVDHPGTRFSTN